MEQGKSTRARRIAGAGAVSAGTLAIAATAAFGHIPGVGNGLAPTTNAPDLRSVSLLENDLADGVPEKARFCFDGSIENVTAAPASTIAIQTYDARRAMNPGTAGKDSANGNCIIASFPNGTDLAQGSIGEVVPGAVTDVQNRANDYASEPLQGSAAGTAPGSTTGPDLTGVAVNTDPPTAKTITYTFDENINPAPAVAYDATQFGFYNGAGAAVGAPAGAVNISANKATVGFGASAELTGATTRFFVNPGAVQDRPQTGALPGVTLFTPSSRGIVATASSGRPEISAASAIGPQQYKVSFNQGITLGGANPALFFAISDDGTAPAAATAIGGGGDGSSIILTFPPAVSLDPASIVKIVAEPGAILATDGVTPNPATQGATSSPGPAGTTNGPDLLSVTVDGATNRVTYRYDENVAQTPGPGAFRAVTPDGSAIGSTGGVVVNDNLVTANFPGTIGSAVLFANPFATLSDKTGRPNPHQSTSNQIQTAPGQAPPTTPPVGTAGKPRYKSKPTIHRKRTTIGKGRKKRRGTKYYGTVTSGRKACKQGRRVILKRNGKKGVRYGTAISNKKGQYTIKRRKRLKGKVYVSVTGRSTSINCLPGSSRKIKG